MQLLTSQPDTASPSAGSEVHLLLTHGASQPVTSAFFQTLVGALTGAGVSVHRFSFAYMQEIERTGKRRPPPRIETLKPEFDAAVSGARALAGDAPLFIGGKSMGGRVASLQADALFTASTIAGLVAVSYPFHPPKAPETLRTAHLLTSACPTLIVQGERDPFGTREEVAGYGLPDTVSFHWCHDGNHDLKPRKASGATFDGNLVAAAQAMATFMRRAKP